MNPYRDADPFLFTTPSAPPPRCRKDVVIATAMPEVSPDPVRFCIEALDFHPDPKQTEVLAGDTTRLMLNCSRQWGKSTVGAAKAVHMSLVKPKALTLVAAPVGRQSAEFLRKAAEFVGKLGIKVRTDGSNRQSIMFPNGSRIVAIPSRNEANIRCYSAVSLLVIDEAARVSDEFYHGVKPMLGVSRGALWMLSTPWATTGFFYQQWKFSPRWTKIAVPATECPRIPADFLEEERSDMGEQRFRREYMCEFHDLGGSLFMRELVERCFTREVSVLPLTTSNSSLTSHWPLATGHFYVGVDLGQKCDFTALAILERREGPAPHYLTPWIKSPTYYDLRHLERIPLGMPYPRIVERIEKLTNEPMLKNRCTLVVDGTGVGAPVVEMLKKADLGGDLVSVTITGGAHAARSGHGWTVPRRDLLASVMVKVEEEFLRIAADLPERARLVTELMALHAGPGRNRNAEHDDLVFALALATWRAQGNPTVGHQNTGRIL